MGLIIDGPTPAPAKCQGVILRAYRKFYKTQRGFGETSQLNILKGKSCKGCRNCDGIWEALGELGDHWPVLNMDTVVDKKLYRLKGVSGSTDWETGLVDDWDLMLEELPDDR